MNRSSNFLSNNARNIFFFDYFFWGGERGLSYKPPRTKYISIAMKPSPWGPVRFEAFSRTPEEEGGAISIFTPSNI